MFKSARFPIATTGPGIIVLLASLVSLGPLATDMYLPSLPGIAAALQTTPADVQLTLSAYMIGFAIAQLVCGPLSDRFGRRPVIIGGLLIFVVASILCTQAETISQLTALRVVQAFGGCAGPVLGRAMVRDLFEGVRGAQAMAMVGLVMGLSPALAPFIGGYLQESFGWTASFLALAFYALVIAAFVWLCLSETNAFMNPKATDLRPLLENYGILLRHRLFLGYTLAQSWCFAGLFAWLSVSVFVLVDVYGINPVDYGYYFIWGVGCFMIGNVVATRLAPKLGLDGALFWGVVCAVVGGLIALVPELIGQGTLIGLLVGVCLYFLALGIIMPQSMIGAMEPFEKMAGAASALLGFVQMAMAAAVGALVGHIYDGTALPMVAIIALCGVLCLLSHVFFVMPVRRQEQAQG